MENMAGAGEGGKRENKKEINEPKRKALRKGRPLPCERVCAGPGQQI